MKHLNYLLILIGQSLLAQNNQPLSPLDGRSWGVVLQHPETKNVTVKTDVTYLEDTKGVLKMDVYLPPDLNRSERRPAIVFLNAIGDRPGEMKVKSWGIYTSWPRLMAANGFVGISMECDGSRIQESLKAIFNYIGKSGSDLNIDSDRIGVYAASANVTQSVVYLMGNDAFKGIKAAAFYYGGAPQGPFRKDLPVYFVIAEGDVQRNNYTTLWGEVLRNNAPWTIQMASNLIHAFDAFNDNDDSRRVIKETISFWKNYLDPIPKQKPEPNSMAREILAAQYGHDDARSIQLLENWIPQHPNDVNAQFNYATSLKNVGRHEESEKAFRKVIAIEPNNAQALTYLYLALQTLNKPEEAKPFLERAEKTGGINKYMYMGMAFTMYGLNKHLEGVQFFEKVIAEDPSGINLYNLACGYARLGEKQKALAILKRALEAGFNSKHQFETDTDLDSLRNEASFKEMLERQN